MPNTIGKRAIVIGAGMGGLTAARAMAPYFDHVVVLEQAKGPIAPAQTRRLVGAVKQPHPVVGRAGHASSLLVSLAVTCAAIAKAGHFVVAKRQSKLDTGTILE